MNKIQQMVHDLCPNGVEWKTLGEVAISLKKATLVQSALITNGEYPVINSGRDLYGRYDKYNNEGNAFVIAARGEYAGFVNYMPSRFWAGGLCYPYRSKAEDVLTTKFMFYYLKSQENTIRETLVTRGSIPAINKQDVDQIPIPLPPLSIQAEIVNLLDKFTQLSAELKAELKLRRKQYDYYRNHLLSFDSNSTTVQWMPLGEVGTFVRGNGMQKKDFCEEGVGCIHYGQIYTKLGTFATETLTKVPSTLAEKLVKVEKGDLVIACTSENVEDVCKAVAWLGEETIVIGGHAAVYKHTMNPKYVAYYFQTIQFADQKKKYAKGVKVIDVKVSELAKIVIPIPPIEEQERIVGILDKFETLVNDLSKGLPAEIALVQKQYEYYRNLLLTFE